MAGRAEMTQGEADYYGAKALESWGSMAPPQRETVPPTPDEMAEAEGDYDTARMRDKHYAGELSAPETREFRKRAGEFEERERAKVAAEGGFGRLGAMGMQRTPYGSVDQTAANAIQGGATVMGMATPIGVPLIAGSQLAPKPVRDKIEAPFRALDEHVAQPLGELTDSEAVRAAVNVGVPTAVGIGAVKAGGAGLAKVADLRAARILARETPNIPRGQAANIQAGGALPSRFAKPEPTGKPRVNAAFFKKPDPNVRVTFETGARGAPESALPTTGMTDAPGTTGRADMPTATLRASSRPTGLATPGARNAKRATALAGEVEMMPGFQAGKLIEGEAGVSADLGAGRTGRGNAPPPRGMPPPRLPPDAPVTPPVGPQGPRAPVRGNPLESVTDTMEKYGPAGREIVKRQIDVDVDHRHNASRLQQKIVDARDAMSRHERAELLHGTKGRDAIEGGDRSWLSPAQQKYLDAWKEAHIEANKMSFESGVRIVDDSGPRGVKVAGDRFTPHDLRPEIVEKLRLGDPALVAELERLNPGRGDAFGRSPVSQKLQQWRSDFFKPTNPGTEMPRSLKYPQEWFNQDLFDSHMRYLDKSTKATAEQTHFRYRDPSSGMLRNKGQGDLGDLVGRIAKEYDPRSAEWVGQQFENIMGRDPRSGIEHTSALRKAQAIEGVATSTSKLGASIPTALSQNSQAVNLAGMVGTRNTIRGFAKAIMSPRAARRTSVTSGAASRLRDYGTTAGLDLPDRAARLGRNFVDATIGQVVGRADAAWRTISSEAAPGYMKSLTQQLQKGGKSEATAARILDRIGFREAEIARIKSGETTQRDLVKMRQRITVRGQIEATRPELPAWVNNPNAQSLFRLKKFALGNTRFYMKHVLTEAGHGNFVPLANTVGWSLVVGEAIGNTKEAIFGPTGRRKDIADIIADGDGQALVRRLADDIDNAAFLGLIGTLSGRFAESTLGPQTSIVDDPIVRLVMPPAVDTASDVWRRSVNVGRGKGVVEEGTKLLSEQISAIRQADRLIRFNTTEGLLDEIEKNMTSEGVPRKGKKDTAKELRERLR